jgi:Calcineurin-like phosphoesterase
MRQYAQQHRLRAEALLMLGDNWYGELARGTHSPRWQTQFEEMYPADVFAGPAYAILGNHDYQRYTLLVEGAQEHQPEMQPEQLLRRNLQNDRAYWSKWPFLAEFANLTGSEKKFSTI